MKDQSKSSFIFELVEEFELFNSSGSTNEFPDESYNSFCEKYKALSEKRDQALFQYLRSTPSLFRTFIADSKWALAVSFNVVWYYDELIVNDPVIHQINLVQGDLEFKKRNLLDLLAFIKRCKDSIDGGYILFSGDNITPNRTGQFDEQSKSLVNIPQVLSEYESISQMLKKPSPINDDVQDNLTQLEIIYQGLWGEIRKFGMHIPSHLMDGKKLKDGIYYDLINPYQRLTKEELISFNKESMLEELKSEFIKDISVVLETIANAQRLDSSVLFYRDADCTVAKNYASMHSNQNTKLIMDTSVYDCIVPYVQGIPAERLFDVRNQMPEAFKDFRALLFDLVKQTMKNTDNPAELKFIVDNQINSLMRKLDVEMNNAKKKWNFQGIATPLIMFTSSLSLYSSGIDFSKLLSTLLGSGSVIQSLSTWSNVAVDKNSASLNPVYFLWKARQ